MLQFDLNIIYYHSQFLNFVFVFSVDEPCKVVGIMVLQKDDDGDPKEGIKCADDQKTFDFYGKDATLEACNQVCLMDATCIGHTISEGFWCFGCKVDVHVYRPDGLNYMYAKEYRCNFNQILFILSESIQFFKLT